MNICEGKITDVKESISVYSNGGSKQIYHFRIDKQQVRYSPLVSTGLSEGDIVKVAGEIKNGTFEAYALRNETVGILSEHNIHGCYIGFAICLVLAVIFLFAFSNPFFGVFPYIFSTIFLSIGSVILYFGDRRKKAVESLRNA